jgi:hypothetical protein
MENNEQGLDTNYNPQNLDHEEEVYLKSGLGTSSR